MITEINKDNFEKEVLRSEKPVVADFWAPWCGYCRRLAPAIDRLESEYGDKHYIALAAATRWPCWKK